MSARRLFLKAAGMNVPAALSLLAVGPRRERISPDGVSAGRWADGQHRTGS